MARSDKKPIGMNLRKSSRTIKKLVWLPWNEKIRRKMSKRYILPSIVYTFFPDFSASKVGAHYITNAQYAVG
jgi:hypothetical protein